MERLLMGWKKGRQKAVFSKICTYVPSSTTSYPPTLLLEL